MTKSPLLCGKDPDVMQYKEQNVHYCVSVDPPSAPAASRSEASPSSAPEAAALLWSDER